MSQAGEMNEEVVLVRDHLHSCEYTPNRKTVIQNAQAYCPEFSGGGGERYYQTMINTETLLKQIFFLSRHLQQGHGMP